MTDNTLVSPEDYDTYCIAGPSNSRLPDGGGERICGLMEIKANKFGQIANVVGLDSNYGGQSEVYDGVDVTISARFSNGMVTGGVSTGRTETDICSVLEQVPEVAINAGATTLITSNSVAGASNAPSRFCHISAPWSGLTQVKLSGTYTLPYDFVGSFNYQFLPGIATTSTYTISGAEIAAGLNRQPAAGARATARVELIEPTQLHREDSLSQFNFAVSRVFNLRGARLQPRLELHNAFNANTVHTIVPAYGPAWEQVRGVLAPRLIKLAAQLDF